MTQCKRNSGTVVRKSTTGGFALLEVLVGMLIFSAGILGMVGLQASMTRAQGSAKYRADAATLSSELIGTMWADAPANRPNYVSATTVCTHAACAQWVAKVATSLPKGAATIAIDAATSVTTITVSWTLPTDGTHRYVTSTSIR